MAGSNIWKSRGFQKEKDLVQIIFELGRTMGSITWICRGLSAKVQRQPVVDWVITSVEPHGGPGLAGVVHRP